MQKLKPALKGVNHAVVKRAPLISKKILLKKPSFKVGGAEAPKLVPMRDVVPKQTSVAAEPDQMMLEGL